MGSGQAVLDVTLEPGDVLYVPLGWVHATSTAESGERSCHATLGVDTYFYGLCWSNARSIALARNKVETTSTRGRARRGDIFAVRRGARGLPATPAER